MKRFLCIVLSLCLLASLLTGLEITARADYTSGNWKYTVSDGKATLTGYVTSPPGDLIIPSTLGGYPVTYIGGWAFYNRAGLTSVTIPDSVTSIGEHAFYDCTGLTSVTIPDSVTSIGGGAFYECTGLASVTIPDSVTSVGDSAFEYCKGLTSVTIGNSVTSIGDGAFSGCAGLTSMTIPDSVTIIGDYAFRGCAGLASVTVAEGNETYYSEGNCIIRKSDKELILGCKNSVIPDSVTSIKGYAFYGCTGLTSVTIPDSVTSIGDDAFYRCTGLTSVTIPDGVTSIGRYAFCGCTGLTSVTIPDSVTSIGSYAFAACTGLTSVTIGSSVTSIGNYAFYNCTGLKNVTYCGTKTQWNQISIGSNNTPLTNAARSYHQYGTEWSKDGTQHWRECSICHNINKASHTFDNSCDTTCNICGYTRSITHTFDNACDTTCNVCGYTRTIAHTYDSACDTTCNVCGYERTVSTSHTYQNTWSADASGHWYECSGCGARLMEKAHSYDNSCDDTCNVCGYVRTAPHSYSYYWQYDENGHYKYCYNCDKTLRGAHEYDSDCDEYCNVCGYERKAPHNLTGGWQIDSSAHYALCQSCRQTVRYAHEFDNVCDPDCSACGYTRSAPHDYLESWSFDEDNHWHECAVCGDKILTGAHEDNDGNGFCDVCNRSSHGYDGVTVTFTKAETKPFLLLPNDNGGLYSATDVKNGELVIRYKIKNNSNEDMIIQPALQCTAKKSDGTATWAGVNGETVEIPAGETGSIEITVEVNKDNTITVFDNDYDVSKFFLRLNFNTEVEAGDKFTLFCGQEKALLIGNKIPSMDGCAVAELHAAEQTPLGSVDGDDTVDANDLTALARYVAKIDVDLSDAQLAAADVNRDGTVDANDLTLLARYVAKIITEF